MELQNFAPGSNNSEILAVSSNVSNTKEPDRTQATEFKGTKVFFYFFILTCSIFGNIVVAWIICSSKKMRTPSNLLILNLSICDLITPLISIPIDFALEENDYIWFYGKIMCKFVWPFATLAATASSLTLAAISLDRYRFIMHPFKAKLSWRQTQIITLIIHITSLLIVLPYIYVLEIQGEGCVENWPEGFPFSKGYTLSLFLIQYAFPLAFMVVMYSLTISRLRLSSERVRSWSKEAIPPPEKRGRRINWYRHTNAKATTMFIIIVVVFAVFMFPNQILWLWLVFGENDTNPSLPVIQVICWLFTYANSVSNPMIYFMFSSDFRNGLKGIMTPCIRCSKSENEVLVLASRNTETDSSFRKMSIVSLKKGVMLRRKSSP